MSFLENITNNQEVLIFLFIFITFFIFFINIGKKATYSIAFFLYLLALNAFIFSLETNYIYFSTAISSVLFLTFIRIPTEKKEIKKEETNNTQEELSYGQFVFFSTITLGLLYIVFIPASYVTSFIGSAGTTSASKTSYTYADTNPEKMAVASWALIKCQKMGNYELRQNFDICKGATKYINANKYKYGQ